MNDTIAAIATAPGISSISIIRISGSLAIEEVNKIFKGKDLEKVQTHTINYGYIVENNEIIDEVLVSVMKSPKTFTMEDVVEINCHGGIATTNKVLELLLKQNIRLAEPGEFTKRAYLNGRIDLLEANAVMDLINSETEESRNIAISSLMGNTSNMIKNLRAKIVYILSNIEVNIDYPEYDDVEEITNNILLPKVKEIELEIKNIINESKEGLIIKNGINTSIIGRPNVGKSSILNRLLNEEKAIVTNIPGTTRDVVEGKINLDGIILNIIDTAGIRKTDDIVEQIGVNKSYHYLKNSDLILYVLNNNEEITEEDIINIENIKEKNHIIVINKIDLENKIDINRLDKDNIVYISANLNKGFDDLKNKIKSLFNLEKIKSKHTYITNIEHLNTLDKCLIEIDNLYNSIEQDLPIELVSIHLKEIWTMLGNITGETYSEELLDQMFSHFCLGK